jgi:hypothetical protein
MYVVTLRLEHAGRCTPAEARCAADLLRAAARPEHRLEHVYAEPAPTGAVAVLFLVAPTFPAAESAVGAIARRAAPVLMRHCRIRTARIA